jgi:hypothetical protein
MEKPKKIRTLVMFIFLTATLHVQNSYCQSDPKVIRLTIINQKRSYHRTDTVKLNFENLSGKKLWISVGFEVLNEGKWNEVFYDLNNPLSGVEKIYSINKTENLYLLVKNVPFMGAKSPPYRLFVKYSNNDKLLNFKKEEFLRFTFFK